MHAASHFDLGSLIPPFDHWDVIAGQGTVAAELFTQVGQLDLLVVCVGGGGLISPPYGAGWGVPQPPARRPVDKAAEIKRNIRRRSRPADVRDA